MTTPPWTFFLRFSTSPPTSKALPVRSTTLVSPVFIGRGAG